MLGEDYFFLPPPLLSLKLYAVDDSSAVTHDLEKKKKEKILQIQDVDYANSNFDSIRSDTWRA